MRVTRRRKLTGFLYVLPALLFVGVFTLYPFLRMFWISLNDWDLLTPPEYVGGILKLCEEKRGTQTDLTYAGEKRVIIRYDLPLTEMVFGFYDRLKSVSRGYASLDYEPKDYSPADLVRMDLMVNGDRVDSLSLIVHREGSYTKGRDLCVKMKELIPQQQFEVAVQAAIGSRVIARTTVKALRKNVTAKCYGGDITRKRKLLEKQKEGKKRMKTIGRVEVPQEAFIAALSTESGGDKARGR